MICAQLGQIGVLGAYLLDCSERMDKAVLSRDVPYTLVLHERDNSVGDGHHALPRFEKSFGVERFKPKLNFTEKIGGEQYTRVQPAEIITSRDS
jgi:hypothetical protein